MPGRPPKPTVIRRLEGNLGKRAYPPGEPEPSKGDPKMPLWLSRDAARLWRALAPRYEEIGLLCEVDVPKFALYVQTLAQIIELQKMVNGSDVVASESRQPCMERLFKLVNQFSKLGHEFGDSPEARTRIMAVDLNGMDDLENFLNGNDANAKDDDGGTSHGRAKAAKPARANEDGDFGG